MRWATRRRCHVDRAACAWLIRRFLDPEPEFLFVLDPDEVPDDAIAFDIRDAELSHRGGDCSFETFLRRYELPDPILWEIAKIVHDADPPPGRALVVRGPRRGVRAGRPCVGAARADRARGRRRRGPRRDAAVPRPARRCRGLPSPRARRPSPARALAARVRRALCLV